VETFTGQDFRDGNVNAAGLPIEKSLPSAGGSFWWHAARHE
jgi:hypothetical protein